MPYSNGKLLNEKIKLINSKDSLIIGNGHMRGIYSTYGFSSELINTNVDSIQIVFNEIDTVTHYCFDSVESRRVKSYENGNSRNVFNGKNYDLAITDISKTSRIIDNYFTFTEDNYNFAKEP